MRTQEEINKELFAIKQRLAEIRTRLIELDQNKFVQEYISLMSKDGKAIKINSLIQEHNEVQEYISLLSELTSTIKMEENYEKELKERQMIDCHHLFVYRPSITSMSEDSSDINTYLNEQNVCCLKCGIVNYYSSDLDAFSPSYERMSEIFASTYDRGIFVYPGIVKYLEYAKTILKQIKRKKPNVPEAEVIEEVGRQIRQFESLLNKTYR